MIGTHIILGKKGLFSVFPVAHGHPTNVRLYVWDVYTRVSSSAVGPVMYLARIMKWEVKHPKLSLTIRHFLYTYLLLTIDENKIVKYRM